MAKSHIKSTTDSTSDPDKDHQHNHDPKDSHSQSHDHRGPHHHHHHHHHHHGAGPGGGGGGNRDQVISNLKLAFFLNFLFVIVEIIGGLLTNSVAILSDAIHDLGDSLSLALMWWLERLSKKQSDSKYSYGYYRYSTLGALVIGAILILSSGLIMLKAIPRIMNPEETNPEGMFFFAVIGVAVNGYAAYRVSKGHSLSEKMIMWHLLEDAMGWIAVLLSSIVIKIWHWYQLDACLAVILAFWIVYNVFRNIKETFRVFLQASPSQLQMKEIEERIKKVGKVLEIHHGHLWSLDGQRHIYTSHVVVDNSVTIYEMSEIRNRIKKMLREFSIWEANIEIEADGSDCVDREHQTE